jgi:hypothetical protein
LKEKISRKAIIHAGFKSIAGPTKLQIASEDLKRTPELVMEKLRLAVK